MIIAREQLVFFEKHPQLQIFPDSCDYGWLLTDENKPTFRAHIAALTESCEVVRPWATKGQWSRVYRIPVENDGPGVVSGYEIELSYAKLKGKEWLSWDINRTIWSENND